MQTRITRSEHTHGSLQPAVLSLLAGLPADTLHHLDHALRPPVGIYNLSMGRILRAFTRVLDELDAADRAPWTEKGIQFEPAALLSAQAELLEAMLAHIEDGYLILKACHPSQSMLDEHFADAWLEKARHPSVARYKQAVKPYRDLVAPIVNKLKHEHGQLRCVAFTDGSLQSAAYYLEGLDAQGVAIPDLHVHPGRTAFSFNRDLRLHFVSLFEIASALKGALTTALRHQKTKPGSSVFKGRPDEFRSVAERVANLSVVVLPDEVTKPTPFVRCERAADGAILTIDYPSLARFTTPPTLRFTVFFALDGGTFSTGMPYFQGDGT